MSYRVKTAKLAPAQLLCLMMAALLITIGLFHAGKTYSDELPDRSLTLGSGNVSANTNYRLDFSLPHSQTLQSIELQFCQESPLQGAPCTAPPGLDLQAAILASQSGETGFTLSSSSDDHTLILVRTLPALTLATNLSYTFTGIVNPSSSGTFYARLQTFNSIDASGVATDNGGLALSISDTVNVSATVPPYLYFCVGIAISNADCTTTTGTYIDFGTFNSLTTSTAETQMVAGTNGSTGYAITANGTTLTSGINTIPANNVGDVSRPGTSQFGMNLRANSDPNVGQDPSGAGSGNPAVGYNTPNLYKFVPGGIVASAAMADYPREYTTSYIANVAKTQVTGVYVSTLTYVATAGF